MTEYGELTFKIVRVETAGQEVLARLSNIIVARGRACPIGEGKRHRKQT
jgi:hypothetical protein